MESHHAHIQAAGLTERSRRSLLIGAAVAAVAAVAGRVGIANAADGDTVTVGGTNSGSTTTRFQTTGVDAVDATSTSAKGLNGTSTSGQGVHGTSSSSAGVAGVSDTGTGVHGSSTSSRGVYGQSTSAAGVEGSGAIGVKAESQGGYALETASGRVKLAGISGVATIPGGKSSVTVKPGVPIGNTTFVLLTPLANIGSRALWFTKEGSAGDIVIHLGSSRNNDMKVAYLVLEHA